MSQRVFFSRFMGIAAQLPPNPGSIGCARCLEACGAAAEVWAICSDALRDPIGKYQAYQSRRQDRRDRIHYFVAYRAAALKGDQAMTTALFKISINAAASALQLLRRLQPADSTAELAVWCGQAAEGLTAHGNGLLVQSSTFEQVRLGTSALSAAACLRPTARALADADRMPAAATGIRSALHDLGVETLVQALSRMLPLKGTTIDLAAAKSGHSKPSVDVQAGMAGLSHIAALDNIATYHREHERY